MDLRQEHNFATGMLKVNGVEVDPGAGGGGGVGSADIDTVDLLTQAEYDALVTPDPNTLYIITDAEEGEPSLTVNTDDNPGTTIFVGSVDPSVANVPVVGDVWIRTV
jgi:hypothetical protein